MKKEEYSIKIEDRCEGLCYREGSKEYHFGIFVGARPNVIYAFNYWNGILHSDPMQLTEQEQAKIIPRLVEFLKRDEPDTEVIVKWKLDPVPLKTSWDLFLERRRARGIKD